MQGKLLPWLMSVFRMRITQRESRKSERAYSLMRLDTKKLYKADSRGILQARAHPNAAQQAQAQFEIIDGLLHYKFFRFRNLLRFTEALVNYINKDVS